MQAAMSQMSPVKAERARQNRAHVRELLRQRQPGFAAALASAEHHLPCSAVQARRASDMPCPIPCRRTLRAFGARLLSGIRLRFG